MRIRRGCRQGAHNRAQTRDSAVESPFGRRQDHRGPLSSRRRSGASGMGARARHAGQQLVESVVGVAQRFRRRDSRIERPARRGEEPNDIQTLERIVGDRSAAALGRRTHPLHRGGRNGQMERIRGAARRHGSAQGHHGRRARSGVFRRRLHAERPHHRYEQHRLSGRAVRERLGPSGQHDCVRARNGRDAPHDVRPRRQLASARDEQRTLDVRALGVHRPYALLLAFRHARQPRRHRDQSVVRQRRMVSQQYFRHTASARRQQHFRRHHIGPPRHSARGVSYSSTPRADARRHKA